MRKTGLTTLGVLALLDDRGTPHGHFAKLYADVDGSAVAVLHAEGRVDTHARNALHHVAAACEQIASDAKQVRRAMDRYQAKHASMNPRVDRLMRADATLQKRVR